MPSVERPDGVRLHWWEESSDGPAVLVAQSYIQHPEVLDGLVAELAVGHRTVRYDTRGAAVVHTTCRPTWPT